MKKKPIWVKNLEVLNVALACLSRWWQTETEEEEIEVIRLIDDQASMSKDN